MTSQHTSRVPVRTWAVHDAKARFSELLETCLAEGVQIVTKRGTEAAVLVPIEEWRQMKLATRPDLKTLLLADTPVTDQLAPDRGHLHRRAAQPFA